jgi:hypothetical protein
VRRAEPRVVDVAVDVVGEQRRGQREEEDEQGDRYPDPLAPDQRRGPEDTEVDDEPGPDQDECRPGADGQLLAAFACRGRAFAAGAFFAAFYPDTAALRRFGGG